ncbi:unnamed protein product [Rhizophagus irregularis]|uniref:C2H2-type domain-containing protein n=4 Tax=Rhizophagus irregularis TaxID=588596 RepID=A0A2N1N4U3_9GLOM|nr:Msn4p [Rhizophagus irregularis DAOM 197198w]PKK68881.1 hypothetical protein RhiirC2_749368 [Rhizophagus irregularis]GBC35244.2 C2H2-type zinc finger transcription factor [Rhizophagus irregularis DAOM 181602=DAOM 197198]CAB4390626.1 unnamed protein product [Rhizophagus irregularis]CAB4490002.1 unnamed protein product [Rhizophagus irregularis]
MVYNNIPIEFNDPSSFHEICSMATPISIISNSTTYNHHHHQKEAHFENYLMGGPRINSFTELLADNMMEYGLMTQATTCSSPESDYMYNMDDSKIKLEYSEPFDISFLNMSRNLSSDSCPDLTNCNQNTPITPIDSPHDQSPILTSTCLSSISSHHQFQQHNNIMSEERDMMTNQVMIDSPPSTTTKRRGRRSTSSTTSSISGMQLQEPQDYQLMGSSLPSPPQKTTGKSRGRRMTNKPTKPGTKSFECTYAGCGRVFKRSEHLKRHIRSIHTLERPFHCPHPHCTKRFSRSDNLSQHVRVHRPNGKEKNASTRTFSNFTPFLQTYQQTGSLQSLQQP